MNEASPRLPGTGPMSDEDLARLEQILSTAPYRDRAMRLDELQGLCVALAMGPDAEISQKWLNPALGEESERPDTPGELLLLLERFRTSTEDALDTEALVIRARATRTGRVDYTGWCEGFLDGVGISETDWFAAADPEELSELMFPIDALGGALPPQERAAYKPNEWRHLLRDAEASLADTVARLAAYWSIVRAPPVTIRREQPKVGRNDLCPCGSGKKFKQCHGKA